GLARGTPGAVGDVRDRAVPAGWLSESPAVLFLTLKSICPGVSRPALRVAAARCGDCAVIADQSRDGGKTDHGVIDRPDRTLQVVYHPVTNYRVSRNLLVRRLPHSVVERVSAGQSAHDGVGTAG